jgi:hypothetical protein
VTFEQSPHSFHPCFRQLVDKSLKIVARGH